MTVNEGGNQVNRCNTIGDFFKNPLLYRVFCEHYERVEENTRTNLGTRKKPSYEFYDFIKEIFSDFDEYRSFLQRLRNVILQENPKELTQVSPEIKLQVLLVFRELHNILSLHGDEGFDISTYFETLSSFVMYEAMNLKISNAGNDRERLPIEMDKSLYELLKKAIELGCAITDDGRIVYVLGSVSERTFNVVELGKGSQMQVNEYGTLIDNTSQGKHFLIAGILKGPQIH